MESLSASVGDSYSKYRRVSFSSFHPSTLIAICADQCVLSPFALCKIYIATGWANRSNVFSESKVYSRLKSNNNYHVLALAVKCAASRLDLQDWVDTPRAALLNVQF